MNDAQWAWLTDVLGVQRPGGPGTKTETKTGAKTGTAGAGDAEAEPSIEPLVMDMDEVFAKNDTPINTVAFVSPKAQGQGGTGGSAPSGPNGTTPPSNVTPVPKDDPDRQAVNAAMDEVTRRYKALSEPNKTFEMVAAGKAFFAVYKDWRALYDQSEFAKAVPGIAAVKEKLAALEALAADLPKKQKAATDEAAKVNKMKPKDLAKLSGADKARMVQTMLSAGKPSGDTRKAQIAVYKAMKLDTGFMAADEQRGKSIAKELKGDKELKTARKGWKKASEEDKIKALKKVVAVQCKQFGIPVPDIVIEHEPPKNGMITNGYFSPADGKLHINMDPNSSVQNFQKAVDLAIHENAHNWQATLVEDLKSGKLKPGDTNYDQAVMFAVNELHPGGYINGDEDYEAYKGQPLENHSWTTGPSTAKKIMKGL